MMEDAALTLKEAQKTVDKWIKTYGVRYFSELTNMAVLTEEVGELARIMARNTATNRLKRANQPTLPTRWPTCFGCCSASPTRREWTSLRHSKEPGKKTKRDATRHLNNENSNNYKHYDRKETMPSGMIINRETDGLHVNRYEEAFSKFNLDLNDEGVSAAVKKLVDEKINEYDTDEVKRQLLGTVELTTLKETDSQESVMKFTEKVNDFADAHPDLPHLATICVFPNYARIVADTLEADGVEIACVAGGFPASQTFLEVKTVETALAVRDGATEIDMVLSVGAFLSGDYETCSDEIQEIKAAAGEAPLKVILETGALKTALNIKKASILPSSLALTSSRLQRAKSL